MEEGIIGKISKGNVIVSISEFKEKRFLDIRKYFTNSDGELTPTRKGISLTSEQYEELLKILEENKASILEQLTK